MNDKGVYRIAPATPGLLKSRNMKTPLINQSNKFNCVFIGTPCKASGSAKYRNEVRLVPGRDAKPYNQRSYNFFWFCEIYFTNTGVLVAKCVLVWPILRTTEFTV